MTLDGKEMPTDILYFSKLVSLIHIIIRAFSLGLLN